MVSHSSINNLDCLGCTVAKRFLLEGDWGPMWAEVQFEVGSHKLVRSFNNIFNVESAEAQRRTPQMPQRW